MCKHLFFVLFVCGVLHSTFAQQNIKKNVTDFGFGFPINSNSDSDEETTAKKPVYIPGKCKQNELLYPGHNNDWICDCNPGFLYVPDKDMCYAPYKRGPCDFGKYLVLPKRKIIPECITNACQADNFVPFEGKCHELHKAGPCEWASLSFVVGVNETTSQLACVKNEPSRVGVANRFGESEEEQLYEANKPLDIPLCTIGCRRAISKQC